MSTISDDLLSLSLRLQLIESLTLGHKEDGQQQQQQQQQQASSSSSSSFKTSPPTVLVRSHKAETNFKQSIDKHKPIVQFVDEYKDNKAYLQPSISAISNTSSDLLHSKHQEGSERSNSTAVPPHTSSRSSSSLLSSQSIIALLLESESDLRQLDRDLRLCDQHRQRDTSGAGRLAEHEALKSRLAALLEQSKMNQKAERDIDGRVMELVEQYSTHVDVVSKLFLHWDQILTQTEDALTRLERSRS